MSEKIEYFQTHLGPLYGNNSRYISLFRLGIKLRKLENPENKLRHWVGYRKKTFEPEEACDKALVEYFLKSLDGSSHKPSRIKIPKIISDLYHLEDFYFKIYEREYGHPPGFCRCVSDKVLDERLLYSESWVDIMGEIGKRGLENLVEKGRKERKRKWKEGGEGILVCVDDSVRSPEMQELLRSYKLI